VRARAGVQRPGAAVLVGLGHWVCRRSLALAAVLEDGPAPAAKRPTLSGLAGALSLSGDGADAVDETAAVEAAGDLSRIEALELELEEEEWWAAPGGPAARALHVIARCCTGLRRLALVGDAERTAATAALFLRCAPCAPTQDGGVVVATWDRGDAFDGV